MSLAITWWSDFPEMRQATNFGNFQGERKADLEAGNENTRAKAWFSYSRPFFLISIFNRLIF